MNARPETPFSKAEMQNIISSEVLYKETKQEKEVEGCIQPRASVVIKYSWDELHR